MRYQGQAKRSFLGVSMPDWTRNSGISMRACQHWPLLLNHTLKGIHSMMVSDDDFCSGGPMTWSKSLSTRAANRAVSGMRILMEPRAVTLTAAAVVMIQRGGSLARSRCDCRWLRWTCIPCTERRLRRWMRISLGTSRDTPDFRT